MSETKEGLTARQARFVEEYLVDLNGTQAAIRAGYSPDSARQIASENLSKPYIAAAIDKALADRPGITRARVVDELARIAFANAGDFFRWGPTGVTVKDSDELTPEQRSVVADVSQTVTEKGGTIRVKLSDKQAALEKLGKVTRLFTDKIELTGKDGAPFQQSEPSSREIARAIADILRQAKVSDDAAEPDEPAEAYQGDEPEPDAPVSVNLRTRDEVEQTEEPYEDEQLVPEAIGGHAGATARLDETGAGSSAPAPVSIPELKPGEVLKLPSGATVKAVAEHGIFLVLGPAGAVVGFRPDLQQAIALAESLPAPAPAPVRTATKPRRDGGAQDHLVVSPRETRLPHAPRVITNNPTRRDRG